MRVTTSGQPDRNVSPGHSDSDHSASRPLISFFKRHQQGVRSRRMHCDLFSAAMHSALFAGSVPVLTRRVHLLTFTWLLYVLARKRCVCLSVAVWRIRHRKQALPQSLRVIHFDRPFMYSIFAILSHECCNMGIRNIVALQKGKSTGSRLYRICSCSATMTSDG